MRQANERRPGTFDADEVQQRELEAANAELRVEVAEHDFAVAQLEVERERAELASYRIESARGGLVTRVVKRAGEGVHASEEVLEMVDTSTVRVEGHADGRYIAALKPGLPVEVFVDIPLADGSTAKQRLTGRLGFVDVSLSSGHEVRVWADVDNPAAFVAEGLVVRMVITVAPADSTPVEGGVPPRTNPVPCN
ncbi:MAG: HlyD family efflux transporter periplasmic adaptor subunit [Planctomycetaceae bacterium]